MAIIQSTSVLAFLQRVFRRAQALVSFDCGRAFAQRRFFGGGRQSHLLFVSEQHVLRLDVVQFPVYVLHPGVECGRSQFGFGLGGAERFEIFSRMSSKVCEVSPSWKLAIVWAMRSCICACLAAEINCMASAWRRRTWAM